MSFDVFSLFSEFLIFGTLIWSTARQSKATDPLVVWSECVWPHFKTVQYRPVLDGFPETVQYIFSWRPRSANAALWLADCIEKIYIKHCKMSCAMYESFCSDPMLEGRSYRPSVAANLDLFCFFKMIAPKMKESILFRILWSTWFILMICV